ncbi:MAG: hypothetical protein H6Q20_1217 [Bacteroidetes bacterium]|jgi:hypothetical protein|nr:hypothetical protein [Bacteroidota bacterium]
MNLLMYNLRKLLLLTGFCFILSVLQAQVKVGDNPTSKNADAMLEIESTNKGLLLPRVALTATTSAAPLSTHVAGMAVYNTATAGDVTPGYYYNDGTKWVKMGSGIATVSLTSATSPAGTSVGQVVFNTSTNQPTGLVYWDGSKWVPVNQTTTIVLTSANTPAGTSVGQVVYNTSTSVEPKGLVYWDGSKWVPVNQTTTIVLTSATTPAGASVGQVVYNTSATVEPKGLVYWDGTKWNTVGGDPLVGNEVVNATTDKGLSRAGSGTVADPYTLGLTNGTAINQTMVWDGTKWTPGAAGLTTIALTSSTTPAGVNVGDMKYNTSNTGGVAVGPVYWDGTKWIAVATNSDLNVVTKSTDYAATTTDDIIVFNSLASGVTLTFPTTGIPVGKRIYVINKDGGYNVALSGVGTPASNNVSAQTGTTVIWDGTTWNSLHAY